MEVTLQSNDKLLIIPRLISPSVAIPNSLRLESIISATCAEPLSITEIAFFMLQLGVINNGCKFIKL